MEKHLWWLTPLCNKRFEKIRNADVKIIHKFSFQRNSVN